MIIHRRSIFPSSEITAMLLPRAPVPILRYMAMASVADVTYRALYASL